MSSRDFQRRVSAIADAFSPERVVWREMRQEHDRAIRERDEARAALDRAETTIREAADLAVVSCKQAGCNASCHCSCCDLRDDLRRYVQGHST